MAIVVDYSFGRPPLKDLKDAGVVGIMRYLSYDSAKNLSVSELASIQALGIDVGIVWETTADRASKGSSAGSSDATEAIRQANALGLDCPIYFAVDFDATETQQLAINAYFSACSAIIGFDRMGAYAGYWPLKRLFDAHLIKYGWQTLAWSGGNRENRAHLYQNGQQLLGTDVNEILKSDWNGQQGEDEMLTSDQHRAAYEIVLGREPENSVQLGTVTGWDFINGARDELNSDRQKIQDQFDSLSFQIKSQQSTIDDLNSNIAELTQQLAKATSTIPIPVSQPPNMDKPSLVDYSLNELLRATLNKVLHRS
jgi:hypothetical protein